MTTSEVNIYTYSDVKGLKRHNGMTGYVLSTNIKEKEHVKVDFVEVRDVTENQSQLIVLIEALKRMNRPCTLCIYTDSKYLSSALTNGWVDKWRSQGWTSSKGKEIANVKEWQQLDVLISKHKYRFEVRTKHQYRDWLRSEIRRKGNV